MADNVLTLIFSGLVAASTVVYAVLTRMLVIETKLLRRAETIPNIGVWLRPSRSHINIFELVIENHGRGSAYDIRWEPLLNNHEVAKAGVHIDFLSHLDGLAYMAPGQRIEAFYGSGVSLIEAGQKSRITLKVDYKDAAGERYQASYIIDPSKYRSLSRVGRPPEVDVSSSLKEISELLRRLCEEGRIRVNIATQSEIDARNQEILEQARVRRDHGQGPV